MGGIYNTVNFHLYHYAGNNPVKYIDPTGRDINNPSTRLMSSAQPDSTLGKSNELINNVGCVLTAYTRIAEAILGSSITLETANQIAIDNALFTNTNELSPENGAKLINALLETNGITDIKVVFDGSYVQQQALDKIVACNKSSEEFFVTARINTNNKDGSQRYNHTVNLNKDAYAGNGPMCGRNLKINDTSGVRKQIIDDPSGRSNKLLRIDIFKVVKTLEQ